MSVHKNYIPILDGWRALSILFVLAGHWLPLGPSVWQLNASIASSGMALFFCLSGFLITQFLSNDPRVAPFLIKRIFRIVPLAWLAVTILVFFNEASDWSVFANYLFFANLISEPLLTGGEHLWSLFVEMQFYIFMALLVAILGKKAVFLIPLLTVMVTAFRIYAGETISIVTWHRVDEIFVGGCVALAWIHFKDNITALKIPTYLPLIFLALLLVVSLPQLPLLGYLRPYAAAAAICTSLFAFPGCLYKLWTSRSAKYVARISYALYVFHGVLGVTALGGHDVSKIEKYLLRIPLAAITLILSHISTFYFEARAIRWGNQLAAKTSAPKPAEK